METLPAILLFWNDEKQVLSPTFHKNLINNNDLLAALCDMAIKATKDTLKGALTASNGETIKPDIAIWWDAVDKRVAVRVNWKTVKSRDFADAILYQAREFYLSTANMIRLQQMMRQQQAMNMQYAQAQAIAKEIKNGIELGKG